MLKHICNSRGYSSEEINQILTCFSSWIFDRAHVIPGDHPISKDNMELLIRRMKTSKTWEISSYISYELSPFRAELLTNEF